MRLAPIIASPLSAGDETLLSLSPQPASAASTAAGAPPAGEQTLPIGVELVAPHTLSLGAPAQAGRRLCSVCGRGPFSAGPLQRHKRTQHRRALGTARSSLLARDVGAPGGEWLAPGPSTPAADERVRPGGLCVRAGSASSGSVQQGADDEALGALFAAAGEQVIPPPAPAGRPRKRSAAAAALATEAGPEMWLPTISTRVRAFFEKFGDAKRAVSLVRLRKRRRPGRFDTHRLRVLEDFALSVGGGGLSVLELNKSFHVLDTWDRTAPGMPDDGDHKTIQHVFKSPNDFRQALGDDIDEGVNQNDWKQCTLEESGRPYEVYF